MTSSNFKSFLQKKKKKLIFYHNGDYMFVIKIVATDVTILTLYSQ